MNIAVWIVTGVLVATFAWFGSQKATWPKDRLIASGQTGVAPFPLPIIRIVAVSELVACVGLVVPWLTGIAPVLTPIAAICLAVFMVGAAVSHISLGEYKQAIGVNGAMLAMLVFVASTRLAQV